MGRDPRPGGDRERERERERRERSFTSIPSEKEGHVVVRERFARPGLRREEDRGSGDEAEVDVRDEIGTRVLVRGHQGKDGRSPLRRNAAASGTEKKVGVLGSAMVSDRASANR